MGTNLDYSTDVRHRGHVVVIAGGLVRGLYLNGTEITCTVRDYDVEGSLLDEIHYDERGEMYISYEP
jgi:hypothetical protein